MKTLVVVLVILFISIWIIKNLPAAQPSLPSSTPSASSSTSYTDIYIENGDYRMYLQKIENPQKLILIANFSQKKLATSLFHSNKCDFGTSGGFYTKENTPLGLFFTNGKWFNQKPHTNRLFNGYVYKTKSGQLKIESSIPLQDSFDFLFQTGPLFTPTTKLAITSDEPARRILLAKTHVGELYFLAITEQNNSNSGPYLAQLPELIQQFNNVKVQQFDKLTNLDGGSASAFINNEVNLGEITPIGSFLCGFAK